MRESDTPPETPTRRQRLNALPKNAVDAMTDAEFQKSVKTAGCLWVLFDAVPDHSAKDTKL